MEMPELDLSRQPAGAARETVGSDVRSVLWNELGHSLRHPATACDGLRAPQALRCPRGAPQYTTKIRTRPRRRSNVVQLRDVLQRNRARLPNTSASALLQASLNVLSAHVLIVDTTGTVLATNLAWQRFAGCYGLRASHAGKAVSYVSLYDEWRSHCPHVDAIQHAIASVLTGRKQAVARGQWYAGVDVCWFEIKVTRYDANGEQHVVILHEDITAAVETERALGEAAEHLLNLQERERQLIAEELHDSTAQHIVAAGLNLVGLRSRLEQRPDILECLERIEGSLDEACKELRSFTYLLHPPSLEADGLAAALRRYVEGFAARTGIRARIGISGSTDFLPDALQRPVLRVVQEALGNVHRHADASRVTVIFRYLHGCAHLLVRDDGRGIGHQYGTRWRIAEPAAIGVGISGIRARLRQHGGKLVMKSCTRGTVLHAVMPIRPERSPAQRAPAPRDPLGRFVGLIGALPM